MIQSFKNKATEAVFNGDDSKVARSIPKNIWSVARRKLDILNAAVRLEDTGTPPANRLERYEDGHSIRLNKQYRLTFQFREGHVYDVLITDYH